VTILPLSSLNRWGKASRERSAGGGAARRRAQRETVGDREGLERWSCSPLSRAPGRAASRWTWALGRVPTWTERCSGAGNRKPTATKSTKNWTKSKQIATKLFTGHHKGVGEHTLRDHRPISTQTPGKLDHGQEHEKLPKNKIRSISSCSTQIQSNSLKG